MGRHRDKNEPQPTSRHRWPTAVTPAPETRPTAPEEPPQSTSRCRRTPSWTACACSPGEEDQPDGTARTASIEPRTLTPFI